MLDIPFQRRNRILRDRRTIEPEVVAMGFWSFIECGWCGFIGCAAPIGDSCPRCQHPLAPEATAPPPPSENPDAA
jgi:hypothetical protein